MTEFKSHDDGTCEIFIDEKFDTLIVPELSPEGEKIISLNSKSWEIGVKKLYLPSTFKNTRNFWRISRLEEINISPDNPFFASFDGILFSKDMTELVAFPPARTGKYILPKTVRNVKDYAFGEYCRLEEIIFREGITEINESCSLYGPKIVTLPSSIMKINDEAFDGGHEMLDGFAVIRAPQNSYAQKFAYKHDYEFMPSDCKLTWDTEAWIKKFHGTIADYRGLRRKVWENTKAIVEDNGYTLPDGKSILLRNYQSSRKRSSFYSRAFTASFEPLNNPPEITVSSDDCLDAAHKWVDDGLEVSVLNMASRRNPGGGVIKGAGAQEEYLFRCSDYYKFLYRYAPYAHEYNLTRSHHQYPLDRNFGGIFSPEVAIFRENEKSGYKLAGSVWKVNMIAVAGMNSPRLIHEDGKERIAPELVEGVKNKIRTIFRIACDQKQRNLVLGALGCGAFHNPPEHIAELFRDVLCEPEFSGAFSRICFAVKTDHNSHGGKNYDAFKKVLDGFIPSVKAETGSSDLKLNIKKIAIARDSYAILKENGEVIITEFRSSKYKRSQALQGSIDIAAGFHHVIGLHDDGTVSFEAVGSQAPSTGGVSSWRNGVAVAACEGHSAMLKEDGTVNCVDFGGFEARRYEDFVETLAGIKQIVVTFDEPYALTMNGRFFCRGSKINEFFNNGREIIQIAAFGCYYSQMTIAALYADGTVKAVDGFLYDYEVIKEVEAWKDVKKICCGNHGYVFGLTKSGKVLLPQDYPYKDRENKPVTEINDEVVDIAANFDHFIALTKFGKIIYLHECS